MNAHLRGFAAVVLVPHLLDGFMQASARRAAPDSAVQPGLIFLLRLLRGTLPATQELARTGDAAAVLRAADRVLEIVLGKRLYTPVHDAGGEQLRTLSALTAVVASTAVAAPHDAQVVGVAAEALARALSVMPSLVDSHLDTLLPAFDAQVRLRCPSYVVPVL